MDIVLNTQLMIFQYLRLWFHIGCIYVLPPGRNRIPLKTSEFTVETDLLYLYNIYRSIDVM